MSCRLIIQPRRANHTPDADWMLRVLQVAVWAGLVWWACVVVP